MKRSPERILAVTAGLVAGGALFGAVAGAAAITILIMIVGWGPMAREAARMGGVLGAVLLPIAGWLLMRRVPLWRALTGTIVGTVIGGILGTGLGFLLWPIGVTAGPVFGAILGFLCVIGLRWRVPAVPVAEGIRVPRRLDS